MRKLRSRSVLIGAIACALVTLFGYFLCSRVELAFASVLYLLMTISVAWQARLRTAVVTAVWSTLCLDFFFTEPKYTLRLISWADFWSVFAFASVALFVSHLSNRIRQQAEDLRAQQDRQRALYELSSASLSLDWSGDFGSHLAALVRTTIHADSIVIWNAREERVYTAGDSFIPHDSIRAAFRAGQSYDLPRSGTFIRILRSGLRDIGVLWVAAPHLDPLMADSIAPIVASSMERARALVKEVEAHSEQFSEQLRTSVLDGLAHAYKTPLTTITLSSAGLAEMPDMPREQRTALATIIRREADRLNEITHQVLRTARLERRKVLCLQEVSLQSVVEQAIHTLGTEAQMRITVRSGEKHIVDADPTILQIVFEQIFENALKYSEAETPISVTMHAHDEGCYVSVHNLGSYIEPEEQERIFTRFYRSPSMAYRAVGTGIGLSVARHAVEAHSGRITVQSHPERGTTFCVELPCKGQMR